MQRRKFSHEFKLEAVRLVMDRGVAVAQAARDLDLHENVLRKWVREFAASWRGVHGEPTEDGSNIFGISLQTTIFFVHF